MDYTITNIFLFLLVSIYSAMAQTSCPVGYTAYSTNGVNRCYFAFDSPITYAEAEVVCRNHRSEENGFTPGRIAYPQSQAEHDNLKGYLIRMNKDKMWLGGRREATTSNSWRFFSDCNGHCGVDHIPDKMAIDDQGCFQYSGDRHGFYAPSGFDNSQLLPSSCVARCEQEQKKYAALLNKQCLCGNDGHLFNKPYVTGQFGTPNDPGCFVGCPKDSMVQRCGSAGWLELFLVKGLKGTAWGVYQPNQYDSYQMCVAMTSQKGYKYNDESCAKKYNYICSMKRPSCVEGVNGNLGRTKLVADNCLFFGWTEKSWYDSYLDCKSRGGTLAKVVGASPFETLTNTLKSNLGSKFTNITLTDLWVGLTNRVWYWPNDADMDWFNWDTNEPGNRENDCMTMYRYTDPSYKMIDQDCSRVNPYVCQKDRDDCTPTSCQNGGTCMDRDNTFACECPAGFNGNECESEINPCDSSPCSTHAVCTRVTYEIHTCACLAGYTGTTCETEIKECQSNPCSNGGSCEELINGYLCHCVDGFSGSNCQIAPTTTTTSTTTLPTTTTVSTSRSSDNSKTTTTQSTPTPKRTTTTSNSKTTTVKNGKTTTTTASSDTTVGLSQPTKAGQSTGGTGTSLGTVEIVLIVVCCLMVVLIIILVVLVHHYKSKNNKRNKVYDAAGGSHDGRGEANLPYSGAIGDDIYIPPGETASVGSGGSRAGLLNLKNTDILSPRATGSAPGDGGSSSRA